MTAITLYELKGRWLALANQLSDLDLDHQTVTDTLEGSDEQMALEEKVQGYEMVARTMEAPVAAIDAEIKRLQDLKTRVTRRAEVLRSSVHRTMRELDIQKITCELFEMRRQKNPAKLVIEDERMIPQQYWRLEKVLDKEALKRDLKEGRDVNGATLTQGESLRIS